MYAQYLPTDGNPIPKFISENIDSYLPKESNTTKNLANGNRCLTRRIKLGEKFGGLLGLVFTLRSSRVKFSSLVCKNIMQLVQNSKKWDFRNKIIVCL